MTKIVNSANTPRDGEFPVPNSEFSVPNGSFFAELRGEIEEKRKARRKDYCSSLLMTVHNSEDATDCVNRSGKNVDGTASPSQFEGKEQTTE